MNNELLSDVIYTCKECGQSKRIPVPEDAHPSAVEKFSKILHCNRCADFLSAKSSLIYDGYKMADEILRCKTLGFEENHQAFVIIRKELAGITKRFAAQVCNYHGIRTIWEPDFVQHIIDNPEKFALVCRLFEKRVKDIKLTNSINQPVENL